MLKSFRIVGATALFLFPGWTVPANAQQGHGDKGQQADKPARQDQPQSNKQQNQPRPQQQQQRAPQQQAQKQPQQQQRAPQQQTQKQPQQQRQSAQPQQQARGQQAPQHQQTQQQTRTSQQPQQQQAARQTQQRQQSGSSQRPQRTQQAMDSQRSQPALRLSSRGGGRIPDDRFRSNFGRSHEFRMGNPVMVSGYSRFQYGDFWFGFVQPWPVGWYYTDDVYIDYVDGGYYMYDPYYPGQRFSISVVL
jgi:hypothetical protein